MHKRVLIVIVMLIAGLAAASDQKSSELKFTILKDENGKPVRNASVWLCPEFM